jgi:hypothetical protein
VFAASLLLGFSNSAVHAISGMETALAALLYAAVAALFLAARDDGRAEAILPWACLLLGITRPEANLFGVVTLALRARECGPAARARFLRSCIAGYVLPGALYFGVRAFYYGRALPLPFYVKAAGGGLPGLRGVASFVANAAIGCATPILLLAFSSRRRPLLLLLPAALVLLAFLRVDPIMGYGHRYPFPLLPVLAIVAGAGVIAAFERGAMARSACVAALAVATVFGVVKTREALPAYAAYARGLARAHGALAAGLGHVAWSRAASIAIGDAGVVPYVTDLPTLDTFGLNEPAIAGQPAGARVRVFLARHPAVLVLISRERGVFRPALPWEEGLLAAAHSSGYSQRATFRFDADYFLWVLWSPDDPDAARIAPAMGDAARRSEALWAG